MSNPVKRFQKRLGDSFEKVKNTVGGGGFKADEQLNEEARKDAEDKRFGDFQSLLTSIRENETITDVTKQELLGLGEGSGGAGSGGGEVLNVNNFDKISGLFDDATTGATAKFRSRQNTQKLFETLLETPGRKQLNLSQRSKSSILGS
jgi:hypothetical protein